MEQLGIKALRPGPERQRAGAESRQLRRGAGQSVSEPARGADAEERPQGDHRRQWWKQRRPEIVEDFEREVVGRVPKNVPNVTWTVTETLRADGRRTCRSIGTAAGRPRRQRVVPGDQRRHPDDAGHAGRRQRAGAGDDHVRGGSAAGASRPPDGRRRVRSAAGGAAGSDPPATEQLIAGGLGLRVPQSHQHSGRQRRRPDEGHHRPGQQGPAAQAGRLGLAARLGVGRGARARLPRNRSEPWTRSGSASKACRATARRRW